MLITFLLDAILLLHAAFILFVGLGGVLVWYRPRWGWLHFPVALWGIFNALAGWPCPLTPLESRLLRHVAGTESWLQQQLLALIYPTGLTRPWQIGLGIAVAAVTAGVYIALWRRSRRNCSAPVRDK